MRKRNGQIKLNEQKEEIILKFQIDIFFSHTDDIKVERKNILHSK